MLEVVIVGAGAAGIAAALEFAGQGLQPLILDVGNTNSKKRNQSSVHCNFYEYRKQYDAFDLLIGDNYYGVSNIGSPKPLPAKLTSPNFEYVTKDAMQYSPIDERDFCAVQSFATGGLANAWGAGLYRFNDYDLKAFAFRESELSSYFDALTREIGISGTYDDLTPFFGSTEALQPPLRLSYNAQKIYQRYLNKKNVFHQSGFHLGHARVAALTEVKDGRPSCDYSNLEFWQELPYLYSPIMTLNRLIAKGQVNYKKGILVNSWKSNSRGIRVIGEKIENKHPFCIECKKLVLSAGTINTSKIVLSAFRDYNTQLNLLDNPALQFPLILPSSIGRKLDLNAFGLVQLNLVWESESFNCRAQGSIMEITSPRRAEFFRSLPFNAKINLLLIRKLLPAMLVMQLFLPQKQEDGSLLSLQKDNRLRIQGRPNRIDSAKVKKLLKLLCKLGVYSHRKLLINVPTGHAIHYAGTLPTSETPRKYACNAFGELYHAKNVFVADSASFPELPAKNSSFTMMANAMRIANFVVHELKEQPSRGHSDKGKL